MDGLGADCERAAWQDKTAVDAPADEQLRRFLAARLAGAPAASGRTAHTDLRKTCLHTTSSESSETLGTRAPAVNDAPAHERRRRFFVARLAGAPAADGRTAHSDLRTNSSHETSDELSDVLCMKPGPRRLTFDMSGGLQAAKPAVRRPLDGGVRHRHASPLQPH